MTEAPSSLKLDPSKDLWANISMNLRDVVQDVPDYNILFVGGRCGGKSSVMQRFCGLGPLQVGVTPSSGGNLKQGATALEYFPSRREVSKSSATSATSVQAQQLHCWELGGGTDLAPLVDVVLSPEQIHTCSVVIVCDLSTPERCFDTAVEWLQKVAKRVESCFATMREKKSSTPDRMISSYAKRFGWETHADVARLKIIPLPIILIAAKFDVLKSKEDFAKCERLVKALRFLAHYHGASFVTTSDKTLTEDREAQRVRSVMNHVLLHSAAPERSLHVTPEAADKEQHCISGADSFKDIKAAVQPSQMPSFKSTKDAEMDKYKAMVESDFPSNRDAVGLLEGKQAAMEFQKQAYEVYGEPVIDACRRQKDEIRDQSRRVAEKKAAQTAAAQGEGKNKGK